MRTSPDRPRRRSTGTILAVIGLVAVIAGVAVAVRAHVARPAYTGPATFWHDQCVDTMKTSRDKAQEWAGREDMRRLIDAQTGLVAATGANCIAIGTPYDAEFAPVLSAWVDSARQHGLRVWFRGNFSAWEGWFDHPRGLSSRQLLSDTAAFIAARPGLFRDGDIFTAAPEAENGGPFKPAPASFTRDYRSFLADQSSTEAAAFAKIGKDVRTNWASMSGGVARQTLDPDTIRRLGGLVTIDHYVRTAAEMGAEIDHYHDTFGAKVAVGEWGAPIPDINGPLTSDEQVRLVTALLAQMAARGDIVEGINYWTLTGGSTGLVDDEFVKQPVYAAIKRYYSPTVLSGTVRNNRGKPVAGATVTLDGQVSTTTDARGNYVLLSPSGRTRISIRASGYAAFDTTSDLGTGKTASFSTIINR